MKNACVRLLPHARMRIALAAGAAWLAGPAWAVNDLPGGPGVNQLNLHEPVTRIAADQMWLHNMMLIICLAIFAAVFGVMFYSIFKHRKSRGAVSANFHESVAVEIAWTVVPFLIVIGMALPATKVVVAMKDTTNADLTIKATGYQWKWGYDYIKGEGEGIGFLSTLDPGQREASDSGKPAPVDNYLLKVDNPLVVPVDKKVRIITTANDVIHAWMVPAFGVKQDAIPGFVRDTWFKAEKVGDYYGQCAELCGKEHAYMPIHVKVLSAADYAAWVDGKKKEMAAKADDPAKVWEQAALVARGEKVYAANCAVCHKPDGKGAGPIKALDGSPVVADADKLKQIDVLLHGRLDKGMPAWNTLSDTEIAAVVTYTKNSWSNQTGQTVQPAEVLAARK
ncbi:MAG: cytochrome c oxidase subunit II [Roseateles depolymerans]|uniref:Cytochrome c oxidase subunit 2 n=1 Tax=Roseateles depolymerans TaxID=76731 RepID=A0A2W5F5C9_9BURK|nr:MAG: cytochrome c oxidase subunit II [Roseateles depolymerans]